VHPNCLNLPHKTSQCHSPENMSCFISGTKNTLPHLFTFYACPVVYPLLSCHSYHRSGTQVVQVYMKMWWICYFLETYLKWLHGLLLCLWFGLIISAQVVNWL